jgi:signal transduction histidine kinase
LDISTRRELAFWIHGELQGAITAIGRSLRENGEDETADKLTDFNDKMIRMMAHRLYPSQLEVSLHLALGDLCHGRAELTMSDNLTPISFKNLQSLIVPFDLRLAIYRIVEEAITNAEKKPDTTKISVTVEAETDLIRISVLDNGAEFDIEQKHSLGFTLINTYVRQFTGHWAINNGDDGVLLTATLAMPVAQTVETMVPPTFASFKRDSKK